MALNPDFKGFCMPLRGVDGQQAQSLIKSGKPVVVKFHSPGCGACQDAAPKIQAAACPYREEAEFIEVDVDRNPELAEQFNIKSIPFVAAFRGGELVKKKVGSDDTEAYQKWIGRVLKQPKGKK